MSKSVKNAKSVKNGTKVIEPVLTPRQIAAHKAAETKRRQAAELAEQEAAQAAAYAAMTPGQKSAISKGFTLRSQPATISTPVKKAMTQTMPNTIIETGISREKPIDQETLNRLLALAPSLRKAGLI